MKRRLFIIVTALVTAAALGACTTHKAAVDMTMAEGIVFPGPPEKPRLKYLWSLSRVSGGSGPSKFMRFVTGGVDYDISDPRTSDYLISPHGIYVDEKNIAYVADTGASRVNVVDLNTMKTLNIERAGHDYLLSPIGVVAGPDGRIYVSDSELRQVAVFNERGKYLGAFKGEFRRPTGLAINREAGIIYVVDTWEHTIFVYDLEGRRKGRIGSRGEDEPGLFNYPTHIAVDSAGNLYVSDTLNFRIQIFDPAGKYVTHFGKMGDQFGMFDKIKGVAVDTEGHIYVVDSLQNSVQIYRRDGELLLFFGEKGRFYGQFELPEGIFIDSRNRVFVADSLNNRIQVFHFLGGD